MFDTIVFHANCPDGWCAAYIFAKLYPQARLVPATYGVPMKDEDFAGRRVAVVDFSWKRAEMLRLKALATTMLVLDHHTTAQDELKGLSFCHFDMHRSGAQLAWDFVHPPSKLRNWVVDYVADRDLWRFVLPESHAISALIMATPQTVQAWDNLMALTPAEAAILGRGARLHVEHYVDKVAAQADAGRWGSFTVAMVNAAYPNCSDVGNELCTRGADIGLIWFVRGDGQMQFSLRSNTDAVDVSVLAQSMGGGGHVQAAGFQMDRDQGFKFLDHLREDVNSAP